ncbi:MAG: hypothetical protein M1828_005200 [Chrysothrix sp. TS-e1954]|nr:MAG: hypothetical protein M1828_005200 [Chrysothrix sp. TS-e1954]
MASVQALPPSHAPSFPVPPNQTPLDGVPSVDPASHPSSATTRKDQVHRGPIQTSLNFFAAPEDGSVPFNYVEDPPEGMPQKNFGMAERDVNIEDIRGRESEFTLKQNAFTGLKGYPHNSKIDWNDDESIKTHYYPEVEQIILDHAKGSQRVVIFDHTVRKPDPSAPRGPVTRAHIDQTVKSAAMRVDRHASSPEEAEKLKQGRYRIINVWRPINGKVESVPLAFADSSSVGPDDIVGIEHRYPTWTGETAGVQHNENLKWYYWSGVDDDERILLQCSDSFDLKSRVPHTAFNDPRSTEASKGRESIEVRCLVIG